MKKQNTLFCRFPVPLSLTLWRRRLGVILSLSIGLHTVTFAQDKQWDKTYGGNEYDALRSVIQTKDGGYLLGGNSNSGTSGDKTGGQGGSSDYWVVKLKADGSKEWDKTYGSTTEDNLTSIQQTKDGGYILGGYTYGGKGGDKTEENKGEQPTEDYWIIKLNADGSKAWDKTIGGSNREVLQTIIQTPDGGYILGGFSYSDRSGDKTENVKGKDSFGSPASDYWIVKLNANGSKVWDKTLGGKDHDSLRSLQLTQDGGYIVGGESFSGVSGNKTQANRGVSDYWVVKLKADGSKVWDKTLGGNKTEELISVQQTSEGDYVLGGRSNSDKSGDKTSAKLSESDFWFVKLKADGSKIWDKTNKSNFGGYVRTFNQTPDGGYLVGGEYLANPGDSSPSPMGDFNFWLIRLNADGQKVWEKTLGGTGYEELAAFQPTADGNYLVAGSSDSDSSGNKSENSRRKSLDYWVVKIKENTPEATTWDMRYGGAGADNLTDVIKTSDGGYLSAGYSDSGTNGDKTQSSRGKNDYWIVKSDQNGKKLWDKRYGGSDQDYLNRVIQTQDGGYLLAGSSFSGRSGDKTEESRGTISAHYGQRDYWVVKVDKTGNKQWDKRFGGTQTDELLKVVQLPTGEYVLGGHSDSPAEGDKSQGFQGVYQNTDYWLVKISATGKKIWDKRYGGIHDEKLGGFTVTADGGFLLAGTSASGNTGDKSQAKRGLTDYWVVRTDKDGSLLWEKSYGGSKSEEAYSVVPGPGNTFFISGTSTSAANGSKSEPSRGGRDYWAVKINVTGEKIWDKTLGSASEDYLQASAATREGGLVLAGTSYVGTSGEKSQQGRGDFDYWVVQLDGQGNKVRDLTLGGSAREVLRTVTQTQDGGLLIGGRSESGVSGDRTQPSQGSTDFWLVKVAPLTASALAVREAGIAEEAITQVKAMQVQAYPNPVRDRATVSFTLPETQTATVKVYDSQGHEVATLFNGEVKANQHYQVEWQAGNKPAGLYFLQLQTPTKKQQHKLLLSK